MAMRQRLLCAALVAGLVLLVPAPVSVCSLLAGLPGECAPRTASECAQMGPMDGAQPAAEMRAASGSSCCTVSQAPVPQAASKINAPAASLQFDAAPQAGLSSAAARFTLPVLAAEHSPPDRQQFLCVFLI
jgi:hypothetical protein